MRSESFRAASVWALVAACLAGIVPQSAALALAQAPPDGKLPTLSRFEFPNQWVGSDPMTVASLRGKGVFLYFFEENCGKCKSKWPELMAIAAKHEDEPIVFLAVNSGTSPQEMAAYKNSVQLEWPVLVDSDRSFERLCDVGEISLQNVMQVATIKADGQLSRARWDDIEGSIQSALKGAKWNVDPEEIPEDLKPVWRNLEFSNYADAASALNKALKSPKPALKAAAEKLAAPVNEKIAKDLAAAAKAASENRPSEAYDMYGAVAEQFAGFPAAEPATLRRKEISKDPAFKKELLGLKQLEKQRPLLDSPKPAVRDRARVAIQKMIDAQPEGAVAQAGRKLLGPPGPDAPTKREAAKP
ncbi:MAG TPA: TlpA disulfide reductase family protein [Pirellulales bacterium]|jgi:thiol-disulfide isomerase/thioredoxin